MPLLTLMLPLPRYVRFHILRYAYVATLIFHYADAAFRRFSLFTIAIDAFACYYAPLLMLVVMLPLPLTMPCRCLMPLSLYLFLFFAIRR